MIAEHQRVFTRDHTQKGQTIYDWRHYLSVLQRKPGALRNGAPFLELPESFRQLQKQLLKHPGGDREMVDVLALTGYTSPDADAILMTANEVRLHLDEGEHTALAIVSGMSFVSRGDKPVCAGAELEYRDPSAIDGWEIEPTAFMVRRKT